MPTPAAPRPLFVLRAEIEIDGVRYTYHHAMPARSWEVADEVTREAFRAGAREGLAQHLAASLPITITEVAL